MRVLATALAQQILAETPGLNLALQPHLPALPLHHNSQIARIKDTPTRTFDGPKGLISSKTPVWMLLSVSALRPSACILWLAASLGRKSNVATRRKKR